MPSPLGQSVPSTLVLSVLSQIGPKRAKHFGLNVLSHIGPERAKHFGPERAKPNWSQLVCQALWS